LDGLFQKVMSREKPFKNSEGIEDKCVISMHSRTTTTIQDPKNPEHMKTFTFDLAYWSHDGFQVDQDVRPRSLQPKFFSVLSAYSSSTTQPKEYNLY
uniref:Uncharacterized protein n=1 Tax=Rhinolophus ferrumequinum TaxID=59479 RepID=A0A671FBQ4_RHIFE